MRENIFSKITVDLIKDHRFKDNCLQCQLRQTVTKKSNDLSDELFSNKSHRICWTEVPLGTKPLDIENKLKNLPKARIYQIVSTNINDLLNDGQKYMIEIGVLDIEDVKIRLSLKSKEGKLITDINNNQIYRNCFFSSDDKEDIYNVEQSLIVDETVNNDEMSNI